MADKKRVIYMWDDPPFRKWFDPELNPRVDPKKLKASDRITKLKYHKKNGQIGTVTPFNLSHRKGFYRYKEALKSEYEFCKDDPRFIEWFRAFGHLNPHIDLKTLKTNDRKTMLYYLYNDKVLTITPFRLFRRKDIFAHRPSEYKYCGDDPAFMKWFDEHVDLNPSFDPYSVSITSLNKIKYHIKHGFVDEITVQSLFNKDGEFSPPVRSKHKELCWNDPKFRAWLDLELNPHVNLRTLSYHDCRTKLYYRSIDSQEICSITPRGLKEKMNWDESPRSHKKILATSVPGFNEWFERYKAFNPNVDLSTLSKYDSTPLYYPDRNGYIHAIRTRNLCARNNIFFEKIPSMPSIPSIPCIDVLGFVEWFEEYRRYNAHIDPSALMSDMTNIMLTYLFNGKFYELTPKKLCSRKDLLAQLRLTICRDPVFWLYCIEKDQETVNSYTRGNNDKHLSMRCPEGHEYVQSPKCFYYYINRGRNPCPWCDNRAKVVPGVNDAVTVDPEIKLFYSKKNTKPAYMVGAYNGHDDYKFDCPYCGFEFTKRMKNIVGKYPKCPKCKDKGTDIPQDNEYMPEGIPYLVGMDTQRPKKMRKRA